MRLSKLVSTFTSRSTTTVVLSGSLIALSFTLQWVGLVPSLAQIAMLAAAVVAGIPVAYAAFTSLRARHVSIELLVTVAAVGAVAIGEVWEAAAVTFLFDLGGLLEARTMARTRRVIGELLDVAPVTARVIRDGEEVEVAPDEVVAGESVVIRPGAKVPVDGVVISGSSRVDQSAITGESYPALKEVDGEVYAGTFNQNGLLRVRATGIGQDTTLARIIRRVEEAQEAKAPTQRFMERFARWYTPAIILLAGLAGIISGRVELALTVLVIGCPGALVISTPVSIVAGIGGAARRGILMKGGSHLEESGRITAVAFDKTGTLTRGRPKVTDVRAIDGEDPLFWAAAAEHGSEHPLAGAVLAEFENREPLPEATSVDAVPGKGIRAVIEGVEVLVGSRRLMTENGIDPDTQTPTEMNARGSRIYVAKEGRFLGSLLVRDPLRKDAIEAIEMLRAAGVSRLVMLTGDNGETAKAIADEVGISEFFAELLPEEKLEAIEKLRSEGHTVAMVGDGINDAPALAAADIGIAVGAAGTDLAIETADIALMQDDLRLAAAAVSQARRTMWNIRENVAVAVVTVVALVTGVLVGEVHMAGGMLIHELSVLVVILNGMRLLAPGGSRTNDRHAEAEQREGSGAGSYDPEDTYSGSRGSSVTENVESPGKPDRRESERERLSLK